MTRLATGYCRFARWTATLTQRHPLWLLAAFTFAYFVSACSLAARKLVWHDEVFTIHIARQPSLANVLAALGSGMDANPPLSYLATRAACAAVGANPVAYRLPSVAGFWVLCLCLFAFVARRCGRPFACLAVLFVLATDAHHTFCYEARPYGLLLGCAGVALLGWQRAAEERGRRLALVGLALGLAAAVSTHYYAVLLFVPLGLAELTRSWRRGRLDLPVWFCFAAGLLPLALFVPYALKVRAVLGAGFWGKPKWESLAIFYQKMLGADLLPGVAILLFLAVYPRLRSAAGEQQEADPSAPPPEEIVAALAFAVLPFFGLLLAKVATGAFAERYALPAVIGLALALVYALWHHTRGCPVLATSVGGILLAWWGATDAIRWREMEGKRHDLEAVCAQLARQAEGGAVVAVSDPLRYLQFAYYAPESLRARMVYLSSSAMALRYKGHDTTDRALSILGQWADLNVVDYEAFVAAHRRFHIYDRGGWLAAALTDRDWRLHKKPHDFLDVRGPEDGGPVRAAGLLRDAD